MLGGDRYFLHIQRRAGLLLNFTMICTCRWITRIIRMAYSLKKVRRPRQFCFNRVDILLFLLFLFFEIEFAGLIALPSLCCILLVGILLRAILFEEGVVEHRFFLVGTSGGCRGSAPAPRRSANVAMRPARKRCEPFSPLQGWQVGSSPHGVHNLVHRA